MVLGDDIRWVELLVSCSIGLVREIIRERYQSLNGVLIKYKDQDDLCIPFAVEKFELGGALETDITMIIKNHCDSWVRAPGNSSEDSGFGTTKGTKEGHAHTLSANIQGPTLLKHMERHYE
ncbi:PB1 domain, 43kDa postsynaptic protein [Artemisia annua]|uniref:PB1 domain, 43kDa postsynaptic protein n=1 Tax=Artemisia annua TaxID=35608 RepID=A0A2U1P5T3_ARTAN|nr:PB1 domain, 43kDa postsynaptic protein [Artemisia annua]